MSRAASMMAFALCVGAFGHWNLPHKDNDQFESRRHIQPQAESATNHVSIPAADQTTALRRPASATEQIPIASPYHAADDGLMYRVQLRVTTADREDAQHNDAVKVRLNAGHEAWLVPGDDGFVRGTTQTFDLSLCSASDILAIARLDDIEMLEISKLGNDGWCLSHVELIVNGRTVYRVSYSHGHWLDNSGGSQLSLIISGSKLRTHALWSAHSASDAIAKN